MPGASRASHPRPPGRSSAPSCLSPAPTTRRCQAPRRVGATGVRRPPLHDACGACRPAGAQRRAGRTLAAVEAICMLDWAIFIEVATPFTCGPPARASARRSAHVVRGAAEERRGTWPFMTIVRSFCSRSRTCRRRHAIRGVALGGRPQLGAPGQLLQYRKTAWVRLFSATPSHQLLREDARVLLLSLFCSLLDLSDELLFLLRNRTLLSTAARLGGA
jgi:hypothetical protein